MFERVPFLLQKPEYSFKSACSMALFAVIAVLSLFATSSHSQSTIIVHNCCNTHKWYLTFWFSNDDASACGDSISDVQAYYNNRWNSHNQIEAAEDPSNGDQIVPGVDRYGWSNTYDYEAWYPMSVKIIMSSGREIILNGTITDHTDASTFTSTEYICPQPTDDPTAVTPSPTGIPQKLSDNENSLYML